MKPGIHPTWYPDAVVTCACGNTFVTGSTKKEIHTDVCSNCHPFYTGEQRIVDTAGQVERFMKRAGQKEKLAAARPAPDAEAKPAKKEKGREQKPPRPVITPAELPLAVMEERPAERAPEPPVVVESAPEPPVVAKPAMELPHPEPAAQVQPAPPEPKPVAPMPVMPQPAPMSEPEPVVMEPIAEMPKAKGVKKPAAKKPAAKKPAAKKAPAKKAAPKAAAKPKTSAAKKPAAKKPAAKKKK